jgi:hypothetical protein
MEQPATPSPVSVPLRDLATALFWANEGLSHAGQPWIAAMDVVPHAVLAQAPWIGMHVLSLANKPHPGSPTDAILADDAFCRLHMAFAHAAGRIRTDNGKHPIVAAYDAERASMAEIAYRHWEQQPFTECLLRMD